MGCEIENIKDKLDALDAINDAAASLDALCELLVSAQAGGGVDNMACIVDIVKLNAERCERAFALLEKDE